MLQTHNNEVEPRDRDNEPDQVVPTENPQAVIQSGGANGGICGLILDNYQVMLAICLISLLIRRTSFRIFTRRLVQQENEEDHGRKAEEGRDEDNQAK